MENMSLLDYQILFDGDNGKPIKRNKRNKQKVNIHAINKHYKEKYKKRCKSNAYFSFYEYERKNGDIAYKRCQENNKFFKRYSNIVVRRYTGDIPIKGSGYKKLFDYCWEMD